MPFLVRKLTQGNAWSKLKLITPGVAVTALPAWAYAEFAPRPGDGAGLSCFVSPTMLPADIAQIAGAMSLFSDTEDSKKRQNYAGVDRDLLLSKGFRLKRSPGGTFNVPVDAIHEEIEVGNFADLLKLTHLFWTGGDAEIKGAKIGEARLNDAKADLIRFSDAILDEQFSHEAHAVAYLRQGHLSVKPA